MLAILKEMATMQEKIWGNKVRLINEHPEIFKGKFISNPKFITRYTAKQDGLYDEHGVKWAENMGGYYLHESTDREGAGFMYFVTEDPKAIISVTYTQDRRQAR